jgi:hypothetical protein
MIFEQTNTLAYFKFCSIGHDGSNYNLTFELIVTMTRGAMTLSIMTLSLMTLSIMTFSLMALSIKTLSITTPSITVECLVPLF